MIIGTLHCKHPGCDSTTALAVPLYDSDRFDDDFGPRCINHAPCGPFMSPEITWCDRCDKWVTCIRTASGPGFAGGMCYYEYYDCGHAWADESEDLAAAI